MKIYVENKVTNISNMEIESIGVGVYKNNILTTSANELDKTSNGFFRKILGNFDASLGNTIVICNIPNIKAERIVIVGLGEKEKYCLESHILVEKSFINTCINYQIKNCISTFAKDANSIEELLAIKNSIIITNTTIYSYKTTITKKIEESNIDKIVFISNADNNDLDKYKLEGLAISEGLCLAKELGNLPSNICTPSYLANEAKKLEKESDKIKVNILNTEDIKKIGMNAFLSVAKGSDEPLKFIEIIYEGATKEENDEQPIVIIGKGITFDSGGISLKPAASMEEMKYDMCGAAATIGIIKTISKLKINKKIIGLIPSCENMPSGKANKPGDVISSMSGKTIEIINTDAEGRLILCDALTYAKKFNPYLVIDIATLTGACVVALGNVRSALFSNDKKISDMFKVSSEKVSDHVWEMPIDENYRKQLKSNFADISNTGGYSAGSITAACFLLEFVDKYKWVHLDIAGTAWNKGDKKGATGRPVSLVSQFLLDQENAN